MFTSNAYHMVTSAQLVSLMPLSLTFLEFWLMRARERLTPVAIMDLLISAICQSNTLVQDPLNGRSLWFRGLCLF